jgi:integrase
MSVITSKSRHAACRLPRTRPAALKTYNNRRGILSTPFNFAVQKDLLARNPIEKTPYHRISHRRGSAETLTAEDAAKLMVYVEEFKGGVLVPYFALCLFAGVRPCPVFGEISKLQPGQVASTRAPSILSRKCRRYA